MNKAEHASYLASLIAIVDSFDDAARPRPVWLTEEYERVWGEFKECVQKENKERAERRERERRVESRTAVTERRASETAGHDSDHERVATHHRV